MAATKKERLLARAEELGLDVDDSVTITELRGMISSFTDDEQEREQSGKDERHPWDPGGGYGRR